MPGREDENWSVADVDDAFRMITDEAYTTTLLDSLAKNLENNRELYEMVSRIVINGAGFPFTITNPVVSLGHLYGILIPSEQGRCRIHNRIFEQRIYAHIMCGLLQTEYGEVNGFRGPEFYTAGGLDVRLMMEKERKTELLAPAGNFEKLEIAIHYGADAVYIGGKDFSLRNFSGNFSLGEMRKAVRFSHEHDVKVYVACNIYPRNHELAAIRAYLAALGEIRPDGVIVADPGIFTEARRIIPDIPLHLSTQANTTNYRSALFWQNAGAKRINMARELSLEDIKEIAERTSVEIEVFVHGSVCISYSGRCLLSSFMAQRESNRGRCCHPCRFSYAVMEETRPGQYFPIAEDERGTYVFNSKDLCMIEHIPDMIRAGIRAFKIEGRMKGINYVASAVRVYREAIDAYHANPETYFVRKEWREELAKINYRDYCTGFYLGDPDQLVPNYAQSNYAGTGCRLVGKVIGAAGPKSVRMNVRNRLSTGDVVEVIKRKGPARRDKIAEMIDAGGSSVTVAQPNSVVMVTLETECSVNDLIRKVDA